MWTIFKAFFEFVTHCFCFTLWFFGWESYGDLAPWPGIEPTPPTLEGSVNHWTAREVPEDALVKEWIWGRIVSWVLLAKRAEAVRTYKSFRDGKLPRRLWVSSSRNPARPGVWRIRRRDHGHPRSQRSGENHAVKYSQRTVSPNVRWEDGHAATRARASDRTVRFIRSLVSFSNSVSSFIN